jgi:hypothetical protein
MISPACKGRALSLILPTRSLGPLQIGQDTDMRVVLFVDVLNVLDDLQMIGMGAVAEIEAEHVTPGFYQFQVIFHTYCRRGLP